MTFQVVFGLKKDTKGTQIQRIEEKLLIIQIVKKHLGLEGAFRQDSF